MVRNPQRARVDLGSEPVGAELPINSAKPKILLLGDSISNGYLPHVQKLLKGKYDVVRQEGNRADTASMLAELDDQLARNCDAVLIHFNFGLHDIMINRHTEAYRVPLADYRRNLSVIVQRLDATGKTLIWATTTPVIYSRHLSVADYDRRQEDVEAYNKVALKIVHSAGIDVNDLHEVISAAGAEQCLRDNDGVHMNPEAYRMLGKAVAEAISSRMDPD